MHLFVQFFGLCSDRFGRPLTVTVCFASLTLVALLLIQGIYLALYLSDIFPQPDWLVSRFSREWMETLVAALF